MAQSQQDTAATLSAALSAEAHDAIPIAPELLSDVGVGVGVGVEGGVHGQEELDKDWESQYLQSEFYNPALEEQATHDGHEHEHGHGHEQHHAAHAHAHAHEHGHGHGHSSHDDDMMAHSLLDPVVQAYAQQQLRMSGVQIGVGVGVGEASTSAGGSGGGASGGLTEQGASGVGMKRSRSASPSQGLHTGTAGDGSSAQPEDGLGGMSLGMGLGMGMDEPVKKKRGPRILKPKVPVEYLTDPDVAHLHLPKVYEGRGIECSRDSYGKDGPIFTHPTPGTIQACIRCHGIKRKCDALEFDETTQRWLKARCSGCFKVDVACVFDLGAASSGFVSSLRHDIARLQEELDRSQQRVQILELAAGQTGEPGDEGEHAELVLDVQ